MSSFGRFTQALGGVVETLSYINPTLTLTQSKGVSPLTANIAGGGGISGSGTTNLVSKFTASTTLGNSIIYDNGTNVGIGTITPFGNAKLQVRPNSDSNIAFQPSTTLTNGIKLNSFNDLGSANINLELNALNLGFKTNETERMRITSGGNVLIGTTTDAGYKLYVDGTLGVTNNARISGFLGIGISPDYAIRAYTTSVSGARISMEGDTNFVCSQYTNAGGSLYFGIDDSAGSNFTGTAYKRFFYSGGTKDFGLYTNGVERLNIVGSNGYSTFSGAIAIGNNVNPSGADVNTHKVEIEIGGNTYYLLATENP
jgi:hypothetical protein